MKGGGKKEQDNEVLYLKFPAGNHKFQSVTKLDDGVWLVIPFCHRKFFFFIIFRSNFVPFFFLLFIFFVYEKKKNSLRKFKGNTKKLFEMATLEGNASSGSTDGKHKEEKKSNSSPPRSTSPQQQPLVTPTSPSYPPYGATAYIDPAQLAANGYDISDPNVNYTTAYVYPLSPQFSVQYYPDYSNGYQSYPGSPALHPQSPPINPTSPPFSPTFQYQQGGLTLSPPTHAAYMLPPHSAQPFPPLHISSPVLSGTSSIPGSPPQHYLPGPYIIATAAPSSSDHHNQQRKRHNDHIHHQQQLQLQQQLEAELNSFHTHNIYVRGLSSSTTDESFKEMCQV